MIKWLNREQRVAQDMLRPKGDSGSKRRCILDCSIDLGGVKRVNVSTGDSRPSSGRPQGPMSSKKVDNSPSDQELVAATLKGDKDSYRLLVERYQGRLLTMATELLKSREDAEDVVQESFVKAFLSLQGFKGQSSFYTWIYRITYNMAIDLRRRSGRRGGVHVEYKEGHGVNKVKGSEVDTSSSAIGSVEHLQNVEGPHAALVRKEAGRRLNRVFSELSEEHRAVIMLREIDGLNYDEIADAVGVPRGTVMSRLHYARKALQNALEDVSTSGLSTTKDGDHADEGDATRRTARSG